MTENDPGAPNDGSSVPGYNDYGISFNVPADQMQPPPPTTAPGMIEGAYVPPTNGSAGPLHRPRSPVRQHPEGTTILVLGILSIVICPLIGPLAWSMGNKAMAQVRFSGYQFSNAGFIKAGRILGAVATLLMVFYVVLVLALLSSGSPGSGS